MAQRRGCESPSFRRRIFVVLILARERTSRDKERAMSRISYVNGRYEPHAHAHVHVEDRGFQFADGVYEVCAVRGGRLVDEEGHLNRLERSLGELRMSMPIGFAQ